MTRDQIARVQATWALIVPVADTVAAQLYERLFALDPSTRVLFAAADPPTLSRKLVQTLAVIVAALDQLVELTPAIDALGRRHVGYGVSAAHYETVGEALLWTLQRALGDNFDDATREAWATAYDEMTTIMMRAHGLPETASRAESVDADRVIAAPVTRR